MVKFVVILIVIGGVIYVVFSIFVLYVFDELFGFEFGEVDEEFVLVLMWV